jgi:hypothetical protein
VLFLVVWVPLLALAAFLVRRFRVRAQAVKI